MQIKLMNLYKYLHMQKLCSSFLYLEQNNTINYFLIRWYYIEKNDLVGLNNNSGGKCMN